MFSKTLRIFFFLASISIITHSQSTIINFQPNNLKMNIGTDGFIGDIYNGDDVIAYSLGFYLSGYCRDTLWASSYFHANRIEDYESSASIYSEADSNIVDEFFILRTNDQPFGERWTKWKNAVKLGAKFFDGDNDSVYNPIDKNNNGQWDMDEDRPDILGDLTIWTAFEDTKPSEERSRDFNNEKPRGIKTKSSYFSFDKPSELQDVLFVRYQIENTGKSSEVLDSVYISIALDPDIEVYYKNMVGCIPGENVGYGYSPKAEGELIDAMPLVAAIKLLQGPQVYIPGVTFTDNNLNGIFDKDVDSALDSAENKLGNEIGSEIFPGATNLEMSSFMGLVKSTPGLGDPNNKIELRNYSLGGLTRNGIPIRADDFGYGNYDSLDIPIDSINNKFMFSGNPVTKDGWYCNVGTDWRTIHSWGPFKLTKGKDITIIYALFTGKGKTHTEALTNMQDLQNITVKLYESNFNTDEITSIKHNTTESNNNLSSFELYQNYPNPFNPNTTIRYTLQKDVNGNMSGINVTLKIFDILGREIETLVNEIQKPGKYSVKFNTTINGKKLASGIYFYKLTIGKFSESKKMILLQ